MRRLLAALGFTLGLAVTSFSIANAVPPTTPPAGSTLDQRIAQRKAETATVLTKDDLNRITGKCFEAQRKLRTQQISDVKNLQHRSDTYASIDAKLWVVIGQLKLAGQDTFHLEEQHTAYVGKVAAINALIADYKQNLDDLLTINCKVDPTGFKALLTTARAYNDQLKTQSADIRSYLTDTVKATLKSHANNLETSTSSGAQ